MNSASNCKKRSVSSSPMWSNTHAVHALIILRCSSMASVPESVSDTSTLRRLLGSIVRTIQPLRSKALRIAEIRPGVLPVFSASLLGVSCTPSVSCRITATSPRRLMETCSIAIGRHLRIMRNMSSTSSCRANKRSPSVFRSPDPASAVSVVSTPWDEVREAPRRQPQQPVQRPPVMTSRRVADI